MKPRIAIPPPHSEKPEYNARALPQYVHAVEASGGEAVEIPLDADNETIARIITTCQGVLLPGSPADVDPQKYGQPKQPETNPSDPKRDNLDELLIQDAYNLRKPVLGICYGLQSLNVWRSGTLRQHIDNTQVNHEAGRSVPIAHQVQIEPDSRLANIAGTRELAVNSSHHQSAEKAGDGLRVVARCAQDGIIEAVEGTHPDHFVLAVQWHPERGFDEDAFSQRLFGQFMQAAMEFHPRPWVVPRAR